MSETGTEAFLQAGNTAPGDDNTETGDPVSQLIVYLVGFGLAAGMTCVSFFLARTGLVWAPSIPVGLAVLAVAQMGVHLVFFIHITSGADNVNNVMALAFGVLIVMLLVFGSLWIMSHLNRNMIPMDRIMQMQR